jgi:hypothetical protein
LAYRGIHAGFYNPGTYNRQEDGTSAIGLRRQSPRPGIGCARRARGRSMMNVRVERGKSLPDRPKSRCSHANQVQPVLIPHLRRQAVGDVTAIARSSICRLGDRWHGSQKPCSFAVTNAAPAPHKTDTAAAASAAACATAHVLYKSAHATELPRRHALPCKRSADQSRGIERDDLLRRRRRATHGQPNAMGRLGARYNLDRRQNGCRICVRPQCTRTRRLFGLWPRGRGGAGDLRLAPLRLLLV